MHVASVKEKLIHTFYVNIFSAACMYVVYAKYYDS